MRFRNGFLSCGILALFVGCSSKPQIVVDVNRAGSGERVEVLFDRSNLLPADSSYYAKEELGDGHERLTVVPDPKSKNGVRIRVTVESVPMATDGDAK